MWLLCQVNWFCNPFAKSGQLWTIPTIQRRSLIDHSTIKNIDMTFNRSNGMWLSCRQDWSNFYYLYFPTPVTVSVPHIFNTFLLSEVQLLFCVKKRCDRFSWVCLSLWLSDMSLSRPKNLPPKSLEFYDGKHIFHWLGWMLLLNY